MTLNVPVDESGIPLAIPNEQFLIYRKSIEFQVQIDGLGKKSLKGTAFLSNWRIILVSQKPTNEFISFDIPLELLYNESMEFPIFGCHHLKGKCPPYKNMLPGLCAFKIWFYNGGCDTFIKELQKCIDGVRNNKNSNQSHQNDHQIYKNSGKKINVSAFVNPNDPSKLFLPENN